MLPSNTRRTAMDPTTTFCPNWACPARGQMGTALGLSDLSQQQGKDQEA